MIELNTSWLDAIRPGRRIGHAIEPHASIGSTNDRARELLQFDAAAGVVVVADEQTAGRGRRGRDWHSPGGRSLSASVVVHPALGPADAWMLALAAGLATGDACAPVAPVRLKWPNDVVAGDGRKVGGILIETVIEGQRLTGAVVGIGLNVDWRRADMPDEIRDRAVALADLAGGPVDRVALLGRLCDALSEELERLERGESPLERFRTRCVTLGQAVTVTAEGGVLAGRAVELGPHGELVVESAEGRRALASGEVIAVRDA